MMVILLLLNNFFKEIKMRYLTYTYTLFYPYLEKLSKLFFNVSIFLK